MPCKDGNSSHSEEEEDKDWLGSRWQSWPGTNSTCQRKQTGSVSSVPHFVVCQERTPHPWATVITLNRYVSVQCQQRWTGGKYCTFWSSIQMSLVCTTGTGNIWERITPEILGMRSIALLIQCDKSWYYEYFCWNGRWDIYIEHFNPFDRGNKRSNHLKQNIFDLSCENPPTHFPPFICNMTAMLLKASTWNAIKGNIVKVIL